MEAKLASLPKWDAKVFLNDSVYKELALFRIKSDGESVSTEISELADMHGAKIHNGQKGSLIAELTSTPDKIKAFEKSIKPFGILDSARTGVTAL